MSNQQETKAGLDKITAPFTAKQVEALDKWQRWGAGVKATCPLHPNAGPMVVSTEGYRCVADDCAHTQDWAYAFVLPVRYCTKDEPYPMPGDPKEYVMHVDATEVDPNYDGEVVPFHCPNCGHDFDVDLR